MEDERLEIAVSYVLRIGVTGAALLVLTGGILYLRQHSEGVADYRLFQGEPAAYRTLHGLLKLKTLRQGQGLIQLGLLLLIFTPIARVALSLFLFLAGRDWLYGVVSAIVMTMLLYSFFSA